MSMNYVHVLRFFGLIADLCPVRNIIQVNSVLSELERLKLAHIGKVSKG